MIKRIVSLFIALSFVCTVFGAFPAFADESRLTLEKTVFEEDEPITVTAKGSGKDWVGIYFPGEAHSIRWTYIDPANGGVGSGVLFDMRTVGTVNNGAPATLSPGKYIIRLMPNDSEDISQAITEIEITIGKSEEGQNKPVSGGDMTRLTVEKAAYAYTEAITVSAVGTGKDWVGIYYPGEAHSIRWTYIDPANGGVGSGVLFDMRVAGENNDGAPVSLLAGDYIIRLMPNDSTDISQAVAWANITIEEDSSLGSREVKAPMNVTYELKNDTDGFAEGTLTVEMGEDNGSKDIVCYWADDNGKLSGYTAIAKFKVAGETTVREWGENVMIPQGATKLLVYGSKNGELSKDYFTVKLPEGAASKDLGIPIVEFQVVSDIHLTTNASHIHNKNFVGMLQDVAENSKNSMGIFIVGDMADSGNAVEYRALERLHASVSGVPDYYLAVGNHDLYNGKLKDKLELFLEYAQLPNGRTPESSHYDFWLNGYHFVFLGNDKLINGDLHTTLNTSTINWLDETLAKDRDEGRPTFLFLHQSLYDTVAGSLPGQGWNGVANEAGLRKVLKKYPEVIMFNGHSHWTLDSERCMYVRSDTLPTIFNTASVAYLWTSYDVTEGENLNGSQGYYIRVYEDKVAVLGRDFKTGEWVSSAQFYVDYEGGKGAKTNTVTFDTGDADVKVENINVAKGCQLTLPQAPAANGYIFEGWFTDASCTDEYRFDSSLYIDSDMTLYAKWTSLPQGQINNDGSADDKDSLTAVMFAAGGAVIAALAVIGAVIIVKKHKKS